MDVKSLIKEGKNFVIKHLPTITMGAGIAGFVTTVIFTADCAPKAKIALEKAKVEKGETKTVYADNEPHDIFVNGELSTIEKVKIVAPIVWPVAVMGTVSIACFIFANSMNLKRNAAALADYQLSETSLKNLKEAALKTVGEKKTNEILDAKDREAVKENQTIVIVGEGEQMCMDGTTGVKFSSTKNKIERAIIDTNYQILHEESASICDLYDNIGNIPDNMWPDMAKDFGWYTGPGTRADKIEPRWSSTIDPDGKTVLVFSYDYTALPWV